MKGDPGPVSIQQRLDVAIMGNRYSTYGPTATHIRSVEVAVAQFIELRAELDRLIAVELEELEKKLDAARVPWTPGRKVQGMR